MNEKIKILIVDDEQIVLDSIRKLLKNENSYEIHTAINVENALKIIDENPIDIVLTDLMMPDIDGLEFLRLIQQKNKFIITIMITGYATINTALQAQQFGAFDYLAKPFTREELTKVIKRASALTLASRQTSDLTRKLPTEKPQWTRGFKGIGEHSWFMKDEDGSVLIGVERPLLYNFGKIQNVYLPNVGDELRQGSVYFQIFSSDLRSESLLSPLSGIVIAVNDALLKNPDIYLEDPYGKGWLIRLDATNFKEDIKVLGL